jgi:hypothetical protein
VRKRNISPGEGEKGQRGRKRLVACEIDISGRRNEGEGRRCTCHGVGGNSQREDAKDLNELHLASWDSDRMTMKRLNQRVCLCV